MKASVLSAAQTLTIFQAIQRGQWPQAVSMPDAHYNYVTM